MAKAGFDCDVLVVGLGPVGAAMAALLVQQGLRVTAIDKDTSVYPLPRAVHFDHEIMRLLQQLGLADQVRRNAREFPAYEFRAADGTLLLSLSSWPEAAGGWASGYMFHQPSLENALREILEVSDLADVRLGHRFVGLSQDAEGVSAQIQGPAGAETVRARYLVGCDGAWSPVREAIGAGLDDYRFDEPWLVVDAKAPAGCRLPSVNLQVCDPARPTTCVLGGPGRHRWEFMLLPGETPEAMLDDAVIARLIAPWDCGPIEIERKAVYRFHGLVADRWREGRVLLAGDSAHQTPPFAGQGMCSGLRDAANLAWKLGAVLSGAADDALLDTYQTEREPHARALIELAIGMGRIVCTLDREAARLRDADMLARRAAGEAPLPPLQAPAFPGGCILAGSPCAGTMFPQPTCGSGARRLRMDDALGEGAWLITRGAAHAIAPGLTRIALDSPTLAPFRASLEAWLEGHGAEAVLVRPDRYVFGAGAPETLCSAWSAAMSPARRAA
jgi:3-(3-hydroxy-phenyl)propionate hydroxylase